MVLHLVDDDGIQSAHLDYFGQNTVTDVISQSYPPFPGTTGMSGELIVNIQQAARARITPDWSAAKELALYIAHGIDHLHGSNDHTPDARRTMRNRELRWLRQLALEGFAFDPLLDSKRR